MNMWDYYSTVWQSLGNDLTCLVSWDQTSVLFSLRVRHMGGTEGAAELQAKTAKDSSSPSGPFVTHKNLTRGAEATACVSEIPQCWGLPLELPVTVSLLHNLHLQPGREAESFKWQLVFSRWGVPLSQSQPAQRYLARSLLCNGRGPEDPQEWATVKGTVIFLPETNFLWWTQLSCLCDFILLLTSVASSVLSGFASL